MDPISTAGLEILNLAIAFGVLCTAVVAIEISAAWIQRMRIVRRRVRYGAPKPLDLPARGRTSNC